MMWWLYSWNNTILKLSLIMEGSTKNVSKFIILLKSTVNKNCCFNEQKMYFWTLQKMLNQLTIFMISVFFNCPVYLFRAALYKLIFVFPKAWTNFIWQDEPWAEFSTLEVAACHAMHLPHSKAIWPNLKLKTRPN